MKTTFKNCLLSFLIINSLTPSETRKTTSPLENLASKHLELANFLTGIHLQNGLLSNQLSIDNLITSTWNISDKQVKVLGGLQVDNLTDELNDLGAALLKIPDKVFIDKDAITDKIRPFKRVIRSIDKMEIKKIPTFLKDQLDFKVFKDLDYRKCFQKLENLFPDKSPPLSESKALSECLQKLSATLRTYVRIRESLGSLSVPHFPIQAIREFQSSKKLLQELKETLSVADKNLTYFKGLLDFTSQKPGPYAISMIQFLKIPFKIDLSIDLSIDWLITLKFSTDKSLIRKLYSGLEPIRPILKEFALFQKILDQLRPGEMIRSLELLEELAHRARAVQPIRGQLDTLLKLRGCILEHLWLPEPPEAKELENLGLEEMKPGIQRIQKALEEIRISEDVENLADNFRRHVADNGSAGINLPLLRHAKWKIQVSKIQEKLDRVTDIVNSDYHLNAYQPLINFTDKVEKMKNWIESLNLGGCDLSHLDESVADKVNDLALIIDKVRKARVLDEIHGIQRLIREGVRVFQKIRNLHVDSGNLETQGILYFFKNSEGLLNFARASESLERLSRISRIRSHVESILDSEQLIADALISTDSYQFWIQNYPKDVKAMKEMLGALGNFERNLKIVKEESLEDVKESYQWIFEKFNFNGLSIDLRRYLPIFEKIDNRDPNVQQTLETMRFVADLVSFDPFQARRYFGKAPEAIDEFRRQMEAMERGIPEEPLDLTPMYYSFGGILVVSAVFGAVFYCFCCTLGPKYVQWNREQVPMKWGTMEGPVEEAYTCDPTNPMLWKYNYVQMQDARLEMNFRDENDNTPLYNAVRAQDWKLLRELLDRGALVDAVCNKNLRTALAELTIVKDLEHAKWCLDRGAWIWQPDAQGHIPDTWIDKETDEMFDKLLDGYKGDLQRKRLIPPNTPRTFKILVMNPNCLTRWQKRKLSPRIKNRITWGYDRWDKNIDLNQFTHIVMPGCYTEGRNTLKLNDEDFLAWRCLAALGNLMHESWLSATIRDPSLISHEHDHMLIHTFYQNNIFPEALLKMKTDMHMGRPKFLTNVRIYMCRTKMSNELMRRKTWEEIIHLFGGVVLAEPFADRLDTDEPYSGLYADYALNGLFQNSCWILKYEDSEIKNEWRSDNDKYTLVPFHFLPTCIASFHILSINNTVIPLDFDPKMKRKMKILKKKKAAKKAENKYPTLFLEYLDD